MTPGQRLDAWHRWICPYITKVTYAIVLRRISKREMILVAEKLEEAAVELRSIVGDESDS